MEPPILRAQFHLARQPDVGMSNDVPSPDLRGIFSPRPHETPGFGLKSVPSGRRFHHGKAPVVRDVPGDPRASNPDAEEMGLRSRSLSGGGGIGRTWSQTASLKTPREHHTATRLPNGSVLVAGGFGGGITVLRSAELFRP